MTPAEAAALLTFASAFDNRRVTPEAATAWAEVLIDMSLADGKKAIQDHYASSGEWIMPVHINAAVRRMHDRRFERVGAHLPGSPSDLPGHQIPTWTRAMRRAIADGATVADAQDRADRLVGYTRLPEIEDGPAMDVKELINNTRSK